MPNFIDFYKEIFLHVIPVRIVVAWFTGVPKFPLDISAILLLGNLIEQNDLRPILIKKYGGLENNTAVLVVHQVLLINLPVILKKK